MLKMPEKELKKLLEVIIRIDYHLCNLRRQLLDRHHAAVMEEQRDAREYCKEAEELVRINLEELNSA